MFYAQMIRRNMDARKKLLILATVYLVGLTLLIVFDIGQLLDFMWQVKKREILDTPSYRNVFFSSGLFTLQFKYFGLPVIFALAALCGFFRSGLRVASSMMLLWAIWLTISTLAKYYGALDFLIVAGSALVLESAMIGLYVFVLLRWKAGSPASA